MRKRLPHRTGLADLVVVVPLEMGHDLCQRFGVWVGKRAQQHPIHHRVDGRVRTNAQRQGEDGHDGEAWVFCEHADGKARVPHAVSHPAQHIDVTRTLADAGRVADLSFGRSVRVRGRHPRADVLVGQCVDVKSDFVIDGTVNRRADQRSAQAAQPAHGVLLRRTARSCRPPTSGGSNGLLRRLTAAGRPS